LCVFVRATDLDSLQTFEILSLGFFEKLIICFSVFAKFPKDNCDRFTKSISMEEPSSFLRTERK